MLTLTENASTIVKDIASRTSREEGAGLRISTDPGLDSVFSVTAAEHPEPGDEVVEQDGATVYPSDEPPRSWTTRSWTGESTRPAMSSSPSPLKPESTLTTS